MSINHLEVNQDVEIEVKKGPYRGTYETRVADLKEEEIDLLTPFAEGSLVPLRQGLEVRIFFAGDSAAYKFPATIKYRSSNSVPTLTVEKPDSEDIVKIQRRQHFRLEVRKKVFYRQVDDDWEPLTSGFEETHTMDISGGGVKMLLPGEEEIEMEDLLEIKLDIEAVEGVPIISRVVNEYSMPDMPDNKAVGLEYLDINRRTRDALMGWLFDYQRKLRRKGLL